MQYKVVTSHSWSDQQTPTDVVVLAVAAVATLDLKELWVSYETGKKHRILTAHLFAKALSPTKSKRLPIFHALTGCDATSFFAGYGKRTAWAVWENFPNVTSTFLELAGTSSSISEENLCTIERFIILIYDRTSHLSKVGESSRFLLEDLWSCNVCIYLYLLFGICFRSIMPESTSSQRKGEGWKDSHQPGTLWNNTWSAPCIKEDTCGGKQWPLSLFFLNPQIGAGP